MNKFSKDLIESLTEAAGHAEGRPGPTRVRAVKVGSFTQFKELTLAIARGEHTPDPAEPKVWREGRRRTRKGKIGA